jgi:hypothetical protein
MGGVYNAFGRHEFNVGFLLENLVGNDHLENSGVNERIILQWILK